MRVIGGIYRGRHLRTVAGLQVRPTSDRLRETLFNILSPGITRSTFLDVCAGSGAVGIEALSRGAREVTFIERNRQAGNAIRTNLNSLGITQAATIINRDASVALKQLEQAGSQFDLVYFDPPYASPIYDSVMKRFGSGVLLTTQSIVIVEHRIKTPPEARYGSLMLFREVKQGESGLAFYRAGSNAETL
jgi:16S rRNA (guanine(966)-N(2))-methyltransferase RsmD